MKLKRKKWLELKVNKGKQERKTQTSYRSNPFLFPPTVVVERKGTEADGESTDCK